MKRAMIKFRLIPKVMKFVFLIPLLFLINSAFAQTKKTIKWGDWKTWGDQGDGTYKNPILPADYSDLDCIRVGDDYYAVSSTFQYSPGFVILHSKDLVNWKIISHAVNDISKISPEMNWDKMNTYGRGIWAGAIRYHDNKFWIYFGDPDKGYFMSTAPKAEGPWEPVHQVLAAKGWDDGCPFWDEDGQGYFIGTNFADGYKIHLFKITPDGKSLIKESDKVIYQSKGSEANKLFKIKDTYYHFFSEVKSSGRVVMMERSKNIYGPYEGPKQLSYAQKEYHEPNQGGIVQTQKGDWFFLTHHGSSGDWSGRNMSLLPVNWVDDWPILGKPDSAKIGIMFWEGQKPIQGQEKSIPQTSDDFNSEQLSPQWEWNYQPRAEKWSLTERKGWLRLKAFQPILANNLLKAGNTITQRSFRTPFNEIIIKLDLTGMAKGQKSGLTHFGSPNYASLGIVFDGLEKKLEYNVKGAIVLGKPIVGNDLWLKSTWGLDGLSQFYYSLDGLNFSPFGNPYQLMWGAYRGDRLGIYTYNNESEAGYIDVDFFQYNFNSKEEKAVIDIDFEKKIGPMYPAWAWFGYDEPNYTYMKDGKKLLQEIADLSPTPAYIRTHSLMVTHDGKYPALKWGSTNMYTEDASGKPIYNWTVVDSIFDTYIERGLKPLAQIGFMPEALSTKPQPYRHNWNPGSPYNEIYKGWTYPPKDYDKWAELVYQWVKHSVERYGKKEVESWYWELWNEPDSPYWGGTLEEFLKLYDYSTAAARRALPTIKIGGPHVTGPAGSRGGKFLDAFLKHCISGTNYVTGKIGSPLDFVAFHAKGGPKVVNGYVQMDMGKQLRDIQSGFKMVAAYPETKNLPIIIGESDPEGCAACGMETNPENAYRNGTMYSSYTAASFARKYGLADSLQVNFLGAVSWSFEFENQPWFYGFRDLATNGVDKPVLNIFRMFGMMRGERLAVKSNQMYNLNKVVASSVKEEQRDLGAFASLDKKTASVMVWNYHDGNIISPEKEVVINLTGIPTQNLKLTHYRIDNEYSNSYEVWKKMGSPQNPTQQQIETLEKAGQLKTMNEPENLVIKNGKLTLKINMPSQGVSLLKLDW